MSDTARCYLIALAVQKAVEGTEMEEECLRWTDFYWERMDDDEKLSVKSINLKEFLREQILS